MKSGTVSSRGWISMKAFFFLDPSAWIRSCASQPEICVPGAWVLDRMTVRRAISCGFAFLDCYGVNFIPNRGKRKPVQVRSPPQMFLLESRYATARNECSDR